MMHGRMPVIAQRQIGQADGGHGGSLRHAITAKVAIQSSATMPAARPMRPSAERRSSDQPGA